MSYKYISVFAKFIPCSNHNYDSNDRYYWINTPKFQGGYYGASSVTGVGQGSASKVGPAVKNITINDPHIV